MELTIPTGDFSGAEITVDVGGRTQVIRCTGGNESVRNVTAEPQAAHYEVVSVLPHHTAVATNLQRNCPGLAADHATAFGEIGRPGNHVIARVRELKIGRTYVLVWPAAIAPEFPDQVERESLKPRKDWEAALVTLSHPLNPCVQSWLQKFTRLPITTSLPEIVPVWPPLTRKVTAGFIEAVPKADVTFYAGHLTPRGTQGMNAMFARSPAQTIGQNAKTVSESFFRLITEGESVIELTCLEPVRTQLTIDLALKNEVLSAGSVDLVGIDVDGAVTAVELHSQASVGWFNDIRRKKVKFSYLAIPPHVSGDLLAGSDGIWEKRLPLQATSARAQHKSGARLLGAAIAEQLAKIILNPSLDLLLDFGAFGRVISTGWLTNHVPQAVSLPAELRGRLLAHLFQTRRQLFPALNAQKISDTEIVLAFLQSTPDIASTASWRTLKAALESSSRSVAGSRMQETK
ncbi:MULTISPECIES: hypothetical protein [Paraburkholderia]|uniref:Uncharacterized protein n=1 Tax=Paraburkholderia podalyriae TaxID=1938811 RepID=A0ABR7PYS4_9BURK|nr:hypothetical protein [Paraburkholderia podalyriae]MBC8751422.1 hypothetical protein [Paraburkholderia podalyriae]